MVSSQWIQFNIEASPQKTEQIENAVLDAGAVSVTLQDAADQPILEPGVGETPLWDSCILTALFPASIDTSTTEQQIQANLSFSLCSSWQLVENKDWSQEWKKHFKPVACSDCRLWICPSWIEAPQPDAVNLRLDPGLAFGTGSHPTTMLCLNWLEKQTLQGKTLIDFGCGSGILGIAALLLGAEKVWAIDNDPQALLASRDNAQRNGIEDERLITLLPEEIPSEAKADIMVANILAKPLIDLAPQISKLTLNNGQLCLSGILSHQVDQVSAAYIEKFIFADSVIEDNWAQLAATKT
ncbi:MAG: Ribosomal protein L11 methyltransferase [Cellvibrionales bacterium UBA7375]|nr:MAG: Ribosomal protein L11 methyltransferase [Cellvibrionales bacterium UBA7375]|tara:strand:+ start:1891 stop:2781 length:891 start_codon:yes stop_codon:yes gene_type:complete